MNITQEGDNQPKKEVVDDAPAKAEGQRLITNELTERLSSGVDNRGTVIKECPVLPLGNQIFLEYNLTKETEAGIKLSEPRMKYRHPKIIGFGSNVKTFSIGEHIVLKQNATVASNEEVDGFKFHVIYETSILGIYTGKNPEEKQSLIHKVKPTILQ